MYLTLSSEQTPEGTKEGGGLSVWFIYTVKYIYKRKPTGREVLAVNFSNL